LEGSLASDGLLGSTFIVGNWRAAASQRWIGW